MPSLEDDLDLDFAPIDDALLGDLLEDAVEKEPEKEAAAGQSGTAIPPPRHHEAMTKLIVPTEVINMPVDIASRDKELCSRLEDTVIHWNKQIKEVLSGQTLIDPEDWTGPLDELLYWEDKYLDLSDLMKQIQSRPVRLVRDIMQIIKSPYIPSFIKVSKEIVQGTIEAISNLHYLGALRECCEKIKESTINELPEQLKQIFWVIRVIWLNAPYYNTKEKLNGLLRKFSNVFIIKCTHIIDVRRVFDGYIESSEETLKKCLNFLLLWRTKYFEAQKMHSMNAYTAWLLEYDQIFSHVDAFAQRIRDLLEICTCQRLFARRMEGNQAHLPLYPGTKASDLTKVMIEVEKMFDRQVQTLFVHSKIALSVRHAEWHQHMSVFKVAVKDMEMMIQTVLMTSFDAVSNIEQGLLLLECFYDFYQRESIIRTYDKLTVKLYKLFEQETIHVKRLHAQNILPLPLTYPEIAGRGAWALFMKQRLDLNYECLKDAWWLPACGYGDDVIAQYKVLSAVLQDSSNQFYEEWLKQLGPKDLTPRLDIPLMIRSTYKPGMIEVNFDKILYRHITEAGIWARIGKTIPDVIRPIFVDSERLHNLRETVLLVVKDYNRIVASLSPDERSLFKERVKLLDRKVYPGLTRLTWGSDVSDSYIKDCRQAANKVQGFTNDYKLANVRIGKMVTKMTKYLVIKMNPKRIFEGLEFNDFQRKNREKAILKTATKYKDVTLILRSVFELFRGDGPEVKVQWLKYLNTIDSVIQEAICTNFRRSLEVLSSSIRGDVRGPPPPIFKLNVIRREDDKLDFNPNISQVTEMIVGIFGKICHAIRPFPRVIQFLHDPSTRIASFSEVLTSDPVSVSIQNEIIESLKNSTGAVEKYLTLWESCRELWETDKDGFMDRFEAMNPSVTSTFDPETGSYTEIQIRESIFTVIFNLAEIMPPATDHE